MISRIVVALLVTLGPSLAHLAVAEPRTLTLPDAVELALASNPELRALAASVAAARARLTDASRFLRDNPELTVTAGRRSSPAGRSRDHSFGLMQSFEVAGQRSARIQAASAALGAAEAELQARKTDLAATVRETFGRARAAEQRAQLAAEAAEVGRQGVDAADQRLQAGAAALLELNTARVELGRLSRARGIADRRRAEAIGDLNLLLGLDASGEVLLVAGESGDEPVVAETELTLAALSNRAELRASRLDLDAARAQSRLAAREAAPSPAIGVSYVREEDSAIRILQGVLSIELPLWERNQVARGEAAARILQTQAALEAFERRVRQEVITAVARLAAARAAADGYASDVVRAMEQNMDLSTESYRAGKIDFLQLLLIRRQTLEARIEHIDVIEELNAARAQLDRAVGRMRRDR